MQVVALRLSPVYFPPSFYPLQIDYKAVSDTCNLYKVYPDMMDSWLSLHDTVKYFGDNYKDFNNYTKPGSFMMASQVV